MQLAGEQATGTEPGGVNDPERIRKVAAFAMRLVEHIADKVPMTARPSLTISVLKTHLTVQSHARARAPLHSAYG